MEEVLKAIADTKASRGLGSQGVSCSATFINRLKTVQDIDEQEFQYKTSARIEAESDPRNAYSMYVMMTTYCESLSPILPPNWDATQYMVKFASVLKGLVILKHKRQMTELLLQKGLVIRTLLSSSTTFIMLWAAAHNLFLL